ncbi:hypothetical protein [Streptomyces zagrosensis]|uniref:Uncharacterized protein n=1 Tax=Streptomyces zagrosensis TaxID=1042984 RepID=A0A7W9Q4D0_9ACTN|nr:hypothetical protein [Streptomyces zagrosensis]MBB5933129.1 hypothetical protein [Streptomyces zagrosensis]
MQLSLADAVMRLSLQTHPAPFSLVQFYPALSLYRVERPYSAEELDRAAAYFLRGNPLFHSVHHAHWTFDSPEDFPVSSFQDTVNRWYPACADGFLLASVTFRSDPTLQGIFTSFPMGLQDGYRCFHFHQQLMSTLKAGQDTFRISQRLDELGIDVADLARKVPRWEKDPQSATAQKIPFAIEESTRPATPAGPYLDNVVQRFSRRGCENLIFVKNALRATTVPLGSFMLFLNVPADVVHSTDGNGLRAYCRAQEDIVLRQIAALDSDEAFRTAGKAVLPALHDLPSRCFVNNYGDVTLFSGRAEHPERGHLLSYQWHMPAIVLGLVSGPRDAVAWTITIDGRAFDFASSDI